MSTLYSVGQMNQLGDALEAAGFTPDDVTKLRSFATLGDFKGVLAGFANIVMVKHVIDLDTSPFVPNGWEVEEHIKGGQFEWDPAKVAFYLSQGQQKGKVVQGDKLREELKGKLVYNANLLDYLLKNPQLIPDEWKGKAVVFWGTIYRHRDGLLSVRYLSWRDGRWLWNFDWLDYDFISSHPAAVLASSSSS